MIKTTLGRAVKNAVTDSGLTQKEIAEVMGKKSAQISQWINGVKKPTIENLRKIAEATGKPLSYFLEAGDGDTNIVERGVNFTRGAKNEGSINYNEALENYRSKLVERLEAIEKTVEKDNEVVKAKLDLIIEKLNKK